MSKQTMTKSQLREAINGLGPLAPDWLVEALEDFIELQEAHKNLLAIHAEDAYHLDEARAKHDEPVGVARTNAMLKQGDTFCVFELGSVPEGTKLYTQVTVAIVPDEIETAYGLDEQSEYAKGWNDCRAAMLKGEK